VCVCVSALLFSVGVCVCDLLIFSRVQVRFEEVSDYEPDAEVQSEVDSHHAVLVALESEPMCGVDDSAPLRRAGGPLTSKRTRFEQTSVGAVRTLHI